MCFLELVCLFANVYSCPVSNHFHFQLLQRQTNILPNVRRNSGSITCEVPLKMITRIDNDFEFVTYYQQANKENQMISASTGASTLPRDIIQWLDKLDLSYSVRNPRMDLSNGFIIAEILTRIYPQDREKINILTYYNCQAKDKKVNNWEQLTKYMARRKFKITKEQYESIINMGPESAQNFLFRLFQFLTGTQLNIDRRLASLLPPPQQPLYKKFTLSHTAKDRELHRVVDLKQKQFRTKAMIEKQRNHVQNQKYNTGLIDWLIQKRKNQIQKEVQRQKSEIQRKTKSIVNNESKVQVRQIQLKCFNSSTSKKNKGEGDLIENKGVLQFLAESCSLIFKKQNIANDLKKVNLEIKDKEGSNINIIQEVFRLCDQKDNKGNRKISAETLTRIIEQFKKSGQMNLIIDNISGNFIDFKKFFSLFFKPLKIYDRQTEVFKSSLSLMSKVASGLHKRDSENTQLAFQDIVLPKLLEIGENDYKKSAISSICLEFIRPQSESYFYFLTQRVKKIYNNNMKMYVSYLPHFLDIVCKNCQTITENLWSEFLYYGFSSLSSSVPSTRVNGAKIIAQLFTDVAVAPDEVINQKMEILQKLILDPWWEVKAQALIIYKSILLSKYKNNSGQNNSSNINDDLNSKTILHFILDIFKPNVSHNILRVGLIQLSELLNYQLSLCQRYLQIILHVGSQIRADILNTSIIKYGPVVYGANTFTYKLTGAPLNWNSIGVVQALDKHLLRINKESLQQSHLQILYSAIQRNENSGEPDDWLKVFGNFKQKIFKTFLDEQLCEMGSAVIKQFLKIKEIHSDLIGSSKSEVSRTLSQIYVDVGDSEVKANLLRFFQYLRESQVQYTYKILKDFAEREKSKYLSSNLVDFMNELSRSRRKILFNDG